MKTCFFYFLSFLAGMLVHACLTAIRQAVERAYHTREIMRNDGAVKD